MPKPIKSNRRYMAGLDGLRALAVLAVIAYHLNLSWFPGGFLGVAVFFVLSGYLITDLLVAEWSKNGRINLLDFWVRRFRRLIPALIVMIISVTAWVTLFDRSLLGKVQDDFLPALFYVSNWWYIFHNVSYFESFGQPSPLTHLWSLAVEEQFYLVWPLLIIFIFTFLSKHKKRVIFVLIGALISALTMMILYEPGADPSRVYYGTDTRAFSMLIGAALALAWPSRKLSMKVPQKERLTLDLIGGVGLIIIILMFCFTSQYGLFLYRGGMLLLSIATAMLIANLAHPASRLSKIMSMKPLKWVGVRSYGIYLWHYPIIVLTSPVVNTGGVDVTRAILQVFASLGVAALSWKFIEDPIRRGALSKWWGTIRKRRWTNLPLFQKSILIGTFIIVCITMLGVTNIIPAKPLQNQIVVAKSDTKTEPKKEKQATDNKKATEKAEETKAESKEKVDGVTVIGDSIMYDVAPYFKNLYPDSVIDYRVGRQMSEVPAVINKLKANGQLKDCIVIEIGTNGPFNKTQLTTLIESLKKTKKIVLVNTRVPRPWQNTVNETLEEIDADYKNVTLVDWYSASAGKSIYFAPDGVHLSKTGAESYANLLAKAIE